MIDLSNVVGGNGTWHWGLAKGKWTIHPDYWEYLQNHVQKMFDKGKLEFNSPLIYYWTNLKFKIVQTCRYPLDIDVLVPNVKEGILCSVKPPI